VTENRSIDRAIQSAVAGATTPADVRAKFDKNAEVGYIDSITGKDLDVEKQPDGTFVATYAYTKKIPIGGPVSLLIDFAGSSKGS
jgi:DNA-dependent RNA polymerase auxiliary subunit epsilon